MTILSKEMTDEVRYWVNILQRDHKAVNQDDQKWLDFVRKSARELSAAGALDEIEEIIKEVRKEIDNEL
jgi:hypothetical protein